MGRGTELGLKRYDDGKQRPMRERVEEGRRVDRAVWIVEGEDCRHAGD